jgi:predicted nucleic acid-binding protein
MTPAAEQLLARDAEWAAPLLWRSEFRSILSGAIRRQTLSLAQASSIAAAAEAQLQGREFSVRSARVLALAKRSGWSSYGCEFVALAAGIGVPLVTNDRALLRAFWDIAVPLTGFAQGA